MARGYRQPCFPTTAHQPPASQPSYEHARSASTTVSLIIVHLHDHTPDTDDLGPRSTRAVDTSSRWSPARAVQDAPGAPRGVKPLGRRAGRRKASGSGGKCASRSAAKNAYAAMQSDA